MKIQHLFLIVSLIFNSCQAQEYQITFKLDATQIEVKEAIGLRGNVKPLSWNKDYPLTYNDTEGVFEATLKFKTSKRNLRYKFTHDEEIELEGADHRIVWFKANETVVAKHIFNEYNFYEKETINSLTYTPEQIKEDIEVLGNALQTIHPNLFKYRDSIVLKQDLKDLEKSLNTDSNLVNVYQEISKFATKIKCSHTFTNPWNQGPDVKKAIFFQPDKLPLTFNRIGKRMFVDKNVSKNASIKKGMEIIAIDGISSQELMTRLANHITSDGNNYEKRLQRLTLSGAAKFEMFDIFYPLEFGSKTSFQLGLKNPKNGDTIQTTVKAISKTHRNKLLREKFADFGNTFEEGWQFEILDDQTALLRIDAFTIFSNDFDWKGFLDNTFEQTAKQHVKNLIIDIRANEGGDTEVAEYILEHIISKPITIDIPAQTTRYRKIPEHLKKYISTWDKRPYDWGNKLEYVGNGRYEMQSMFVPTRKTYKPKKNNFKGKVYLLTSAENSSATHIMSTYAKKYELATLVGQETGGNQKGLNGGYMFFLRLPNSRIELDIPVFGINILKDTPETYDGGIRPDIPVEKNVDDLISGADTEMKVVLENIASGK